MDKEWVRSTVEQQVFSVYGLKNPSPADVEKMVDKVFSNTSVLQFPGYKEVNPLFGCYQGTLQLKNHYKSFYSAVEILGLKKQFIIVDGFGASAHFQAEFRFKGSGSIYDFEIIALVELGMEGHVRDLKLHFDTSTFMKAFKTQNAKFKDVRGIMPHPNFNPKSGANSSLAASNLYNTFMMLYRGEGSWDDFYTLFSEDMEVVFKSNVDVIPYAGQYSGIDGLKQWFKDLLSIWSLATFNFTKVYSEGNVADYAMDEQHYYTNPDGSRRYLSVYLVQSWSVHENGKINLFQSHHDSGWMDNTFFATQVYKDYYGYPADYPPKKKD